MPSKDLKQHNLFEAVAHNPAFAEKKGIPQSVGQDFVKADGHTFDHAAHHAALKKDARSAPTMMRPAGPGGKRRAE